MKWNRTSWACIAAIVAAVLALAGQGQASDAKGNYSIRGVGSQTCQSLGQQLEKDPSGAVPVASWMLGYLSAVNRFEPGTYDISPVTDVRALTNIVLALCKQNPSSRFEVVVNNMLQALGRARVRADSPFVEMKSGQASASLRQETLVLVQQRLNQNGLLKAKPDGAFGPQTETALKEYQTAEKLPVTGVADASTVLRLLVEQAPKPQPARQQPPQQSPRQQPPRN